MSGILRSERLTRPQRLKFFGRGPMTMDATAGVDAATKKLGCNSNSPEVGFLGNSNGGFVSRADNLSAHLHGRVRKPGSVIPTVFGQNFRGSADLAVGVMGKENARLNLRLDPPDMLRGRVCCGNTAIKIRWRSGTGTQARAGLGKLRELFWEPVDAPAQAGERPLPKAREPVGV